MIVRHVKNHFVVDGDEYSPYGPLPSKKLPESARRFWSRVCLAETEEAIVAYDEGQLVGFFRFAPYRRCDGSVLLIAAGTWVSATCRKSGLGRKMWERAIAVSSARWAAPLEAVDVSIGSVGGAKFVDKLAAAYPNLRWAVAGMRGKNVRENEQRWGAKMREAEHAAE